MVLSNQEPVGTATRWHQQPVIDLVISTQKRGFKLQNANSVRISGINEPTKINIAQLKYDMQCISNVCSAFPMRLRLACFAPNHGFSSSSWHRCRSYFGNFNNGNRHLAKC